MTQMSTLFPYESRYLSVDGDELHYVDVGRGPTLLLVPGSPMWSFMYRGVIERLRDNFRCVAVDLPGLGHSTAEVEPGRAFARGAELLAGFVRTLDLHDITLVSHATAGPCSLAAAIEEQDRVARLVVSNTFAWPLDEMPSLAKFVRIVSSRLFGFFNIALGLLPRIAGRFGRRVSRFTAEERDAIVAPYRTIRTRRALQAYLNGLRTERSMFERLWTDLDRLRDLPALLVFGGHDNGYRAGTMERFQQKLPRHRSVVFEDSGHFLCEDEPNRFADLVHDWVTA